MFQPAALIRIPERHISGSQAPAQIEVAAKGDLFATPSIFPEPVTSGASKVELPRKRVRKRWTDVERAHVPATLPCSLPGQVQLGAQPLAGGENQS